MIECATYVSARIAILQTSGDDLIDRRTRHHAKLPAAGHRARQPPR